MKRLFTPKALAWCVLLAVAGCGSISDTIATSALSEQDCTPAEDSQAVTDSFLARLFPDSAEDVPYACALDPESATCKPELFHLGGVYPFGAKIPTQLECRGGDSIALASRCDSYAKHLISRGLDQGNLAVMVEGVTRMRDVMVLVSQKAPQISYYKPTSPDNLFVRWLLDNKINPLQLGRCTTGTAEDRYYCLATDEDAPGKNVVRGLVRAMDRHNGVLARNGELLGAADREHAIFVSSTGPANTYLARKRHWNPTVGPGVPYIQTLGKLAALRLLDGSATEQDEVTELEALLAFPSFTPQSNHEVFGLSLGLISAQANAWKWDETIEHPVMRDPRIAADLAEMFITLRMTALTSRLLGDCPMRNEHVDVWVHFSGLNFIPELLDCGLEAGETETVFLEGCWLGMPVEGGTVIDCGYQVCVDGLPIDDCIRWAATVELDTCEDQFEFGPGQPIGSCGLTAQLGSVTLAENPTNTEFLETCLVGMFYNGGTVIDCGYQVCVDGLPIDDCIRWAATVEYPDETYADWVDYGQFWLELMLNDNWVGMHIDEILAEAITERSVKLAYFDLLSSDDDGDGALTAAEVYDHTNDGNPDLHYNWVNPDTITDHAINILNAGVGWAECQAELAQTSGNYSSDLVTSLSCDEDVDGDGITDTDCLTDLGLSEWQFVPMPIAVRICPEYSARIFGVTEPVSWNECATPWSFTNAVEDYLADGFNGSREDEIDFYAEFGDEAKTPTIDFAAEAYQLTQSVAGIYAHRADFASVVGDIPGAYMGDASAWYDDYAGLSVVDGHLETGEDIMAKGIDLVADFYAVDVDGESGADIIARLSADGYNACQGNCDDNDENHVRALFFRRTRDAIEAYHQVATGRFEVQWRRLDGVKCFDSDADGVYDRCDSCVAAVDTDSDGVFDDVDCIDDGDLDGDGVEDVPDCALQCGYFDTARALRDDGMARLDALAADLDTQSQHSALVALPDVGSFVGDASGFAAGTSAQLGLDWDMMLGGQDWLGYKAGLWYPGINIDPGDGMTDTVDQITLAVGELQAAALSPNFDSYIHNYMVRTAQLEDYSEAIDNALVAAAGDVADYCSGGVDACITDWDDMYMLVESVNNVLWRSVCDRTIRLWYYDPGAGGNDYIDVDIGVPAEECPVLISADFDATAGMTGAIPDQAVVLAAELLNILAAVEDLELYIGMIEADNEARKDLGEVLDEREEAEQRIRNIKDSIICGVAVVGAAAVSIATVICTAGTFGACAAPAVGANVVAWSGAASTCASVFADDISQGGTPTSEELERAYQEYTMTLQANQEAYTAASKTLDIITRTSSYSVQVQAMATIIASLEHLIAYQNTAFDNLYDSYLFDPSIQLFDDESLGSLKNEFRGFAERVRDFHHLVQYDLGQAVKEDGSFALTQALSYYLPRLSEITIFKPYNGAFDDAYLELLTTTGTVAGVAAGERALNLLSYASLVKLVHDSFVSIYSDRQGNFAPAFVGSTGSGMPFIDSDGDGDVDASDEPRDVRVATNPGDFGTLGISPFFDPISYVDIDTDADGITCAAGEIDLSDWCGNYVDTGLPVDDDSCLRVADLPEKERRSLAYADLMTKGIGVNTIECYESVVGPCQQWNYDLTICLVPGEVMSYVTVATPANGSVFTYAELVGTPTIYEATNPAYYAAQTPTVQRIMDRFLLVMDQNPIILDGDDLEVQPGTFLFLINMSSGGNGFTDATFDPEADLLYRGGGPAAADTISEQMTSMALICEDEYACPDQFNSYGARVFLLNPGYLGDRCQEAITRRQERVAFDMDPDPVSIAAARITSTLTFTDDVQALLESQYSLDVMGAQPVQGNSWIVSLPAHATIDGQQLFDEFGETTGWSLYRENPSVTDRPRVRLALGYTYYDAGAQTGDFDYDVSGLLQCHGPSGAVCVNGTCD